jgi:dephospho-CoA kinase
MIIGLTGQIGSGKSTAAEILASLGAVVIDADRIGRAVVEESARLRNELARAFGNDVLDKRGNLKRKLVAERAFASEEQTRQLNDIVHPYLLRKLRKEVRKHARKHHVVIDAALLLYWGMDSEVDLVLVIHAGRDERLRRLRSKGVSNRDALARERAQLPFREFQLRADVVILNNGNAEDLERKLKSFWKECVQDSCV